MFSCVEHTDLTDRGADLTYEEEEEKEEEEEEGEEKEERN